MTTSIAAILKQYNSVFPQEEASLRPLAKQLQRAGGEQAITSRQTFDTGHVVVGAIIVSLPSKQVLLLDHTALQLTLQPGGHIDPDDATLLAATYRECEEETGITADQIRYIPLSEQNSELPFNIQVEAIPENPVKQEPAHQHYDFWYLFTVADGTPVNSGDKGVANQQWIDFVAFADMPQFSRQAEKIEKLLTLV